MAKTPLTAFASGPTRPVADAMIRKSKWIDGIAPETPLTAAARTAIAPRLRLVWYYLKRAAREAEHDVEFVHQLRVCSRRAMATLEVFDAVLPARRAERMRRHLRRIRREAGEARDLDVMALRYREWAKTEAGRGGRDFLAVLERRRAEAQRPIERKYGKLRRRDFMSLVDGLLVRIRPRRELAERGEPSFGPAARACLNPLVESFFEAGSGELAEAAAMHEFRIRGKQLRYAMEIFVGAYGPPLREELYPVVEQLQERLGSVNDHAGALARLQGWSAHDGIDVPRELLDNLIAKEEQACRESEEQFRSYWTPARMAELRSGFDEILFRPSERQAG